MKKSNILVIYSSKNVKGKKDATGAFIPEAKAFAKLHGVPESNMLGIPCPGMPAKKRYKQLTDFLKTKKNIAWIAMFGHGYSSGMQFGLKKGNLPQFVSVLKKSCTKKVKLSLYACSTASTSKHTRQRNAPGTDNGYADQLRDHMLAHGFKGGWIDAHLTPGHTTHNPFIMRFYVEPPFEGGWDVKGGEWLVSPKSKLWKPWKKAVQNRKSMFRFQFSLMTEPEVYDYLK